jgi:hypothetical protein
LTSGLEADMVNPSKSTADAAALLGVSELYRGVAALELVDMSRVTTAEAGVAVAADDKAKVAEAHTHFRAAAEALARAIDVCSRARAKAGKQDPAMALDCDLAGFGKLSEILDRIGSRGATLPAPEDLQAAMSAINDELGFWKTSAQSLRGVPGHGPAKPKPRR